jgi:hypothetical protein
MSIRDRERAAARIHIEEQLALILGFRNSYSSYEAMRRLTERPAHKARIAAALGLIGAQERGRWKQARAGSPRRGPGGRR